MTTRRVLLQGATAAILAFLLLGTVIASTLQQQTPLTSDQAIFMTLDADHTQDARVRATVDRLAMATPIQVLPSPTPRTLTPSPALTWTRTPTTDASEPTTENLATLSKTPTFFLATNSRTPTRTITSTPQFSRTPGNATATVLPYLELDYSCHVITLDDLTRRQTPGVTGVKLGTIPKGTELLIYPNDSTLMFDTNYWYVRVHEDSGGGYIFFAYTIPPEEMEPGVIPRVVEAYLEQSQAGEFCQPTFPYLRN